MRNEIDMQNEKSRIESALLDPATSPEFAASPYDVIINSKVMPLQVED